MIATGEEEFRRTTKRLERYLDKNSLTLNTDKSMIVIFGKGRNKTKKQEWKWKRKVLDVVKAYCSKEMEIW